MRTHLEFRSADLMDESAEEIGGAKVAELIASSLPDLGFVIKGVAQEDWGWVVHVENEEFPLWIGCGHYLEYADGHLCFIEPSKPFVRRWLKRIATGQVVERLALALEKLLKDSEKITDLRWWTDAEAARR